MKKEHTSQKEIILDILNQKGSITSMEAFLTFGITRLSAIIFNLKREGYPIESIPKNTKNRYGNNCHYVEYRKAW